MMDVPQSGPRVSPGCSSAAVLLLMLLVAPLLFMNLITAALVELRLDVAWIPAIVVGIFLGSQVNLTVWSRQALHDVLVPAPTLFGLPRWGVVRTLERQAVALNVGGGLIPLALALYELNGLYLSSGWGLVVRFLPILAAATLAARLGSRVVPGVGVTLAPVFPALTAAFLALSLMPGQAPGAAFAAGVLGVIVGADLSRIRAVLDSGIGTVSIGGAGTFDGILLTGLLSVFLA